MTRVLTAGLLALPLLIATSTPVHAQNGGFPGLVPSIGPFGGCSHLGCGGFCFQFLGKIHQHGPLFNYGPYQGYYPFEPYGPWNSNLQYTGPRGPLNDCNGAGCGHCGRCRGAGLRDRLAGLHHRDDDCGGGGCGNWGPYARATLSNVFHRCHPFANHCGHGSAATCGSSGGCGAAIGGCAGASSVSSSTVVSNPVEAVSATETPVVEPGFPRRER